MGQESEVGKLAGQPLGKGESAMVQKQIRRTKNLSHHEQRTTLDW